MLKIGELAKLTNLSRDTLRFYEKKGLIEPAARNSAGYRLYSDANISLINFIQASKEIGMSLADIKELIDIKLHPEEHSCLQVKTITQHKLDLIEEKITQLKLIYTSLKELNDKCCGKDNDTAANCSILSNLNLKYKK